MLLDWPLSLGGIPEENCDMIHSQLELKTRHFHMKRAEGISILHAFFGWPLQTFIEMAP